MGDAFQDNDTNHWKRLLTLAENLIDHPNPATQRDLIQATAAELLKGTARLWFEKQSHRFPGLSQNSSLETDSPSALMEEAHRQRGTIFLPKPGTQPGGSQTAAIAIPLISNDLVIGVLEVRREQGPPYDQTDRDTIERLAALSALALQITRQASIKNWRYEQLSLVREVSSQIANVLDLDILTRRVTQLIRDRFQYYYVAIFTVEPGSETLCYQASAHQDRTAAGGQAPLIPEIHLGEGIIGTVAQSGEQILAPNVVQDRHYRSFDSLPETRSEVAFPLKVENRVLGVLDVQSDQTDAFHEMDILVLRALADNIALAVEGTRLYSDIQRRAEQLTIVSEVGRTITSILDLDHLLDVVVELIQKRLGYPFVHLFTVHPGRRKVIYRAGSGSKNEKMREQEVCYGLDDSLGIIPWVARNGKTLIANDVDREPIYRASELPPHNTRSEMAVPLIYGGETTGVLDIQSDRLDAFSGEDRFLFEALADNISIALRNASLYRSESWRRQVAESLRDVAGLLSSEAALDKVLDAILKELERILPCEIAAVWLLDKNIPENGDLSSLSLRLAGVRGGKKERLDDARVMTTENKRIFMDTIQNNQPRVRLSSEPLGPIGIAFDYASDYSSLIAPLRAGDQPLGLIALAHPTSGRYGSEALSMTAAFASYAAVAIQNNRLFSSAQEQAWVSTVMLQVADAAQTAATIDELFDIILRLTPLLVGVKSCALFTWNPSLEGFTLAADHELDPLLKVALHDQFLPVESAPAFQALRETATSVQVHDPFREFGFPIDAPSDGRHSTMVLLPLATRADFLGAFLIEQDSRPGNGSIEAYNDQRSAILQGIAQQTAIAVENIRLLEAKQEEAYVTAVLLQVAQAVVSLNDLNDILTAIVHIMPILVGIDSCIIYLWDQDFQLFRPSQAYAGDGQIEAGILAHPYAQDEYPLLEEVYQSDSLVVYPLQAPAQPPAEWHSIASPLDNVDPKSRLKDKNDVLLGFPLSVKGDVFGVMVAQESSNSPDLRERRLEIITGIAQQAALAIQNDHLNREMLGRERIEREFQLARDIQRTFLPSVLPSYDGWEVDVRWRTALRVGGDFYDCFDLPSNRLGIVIADVSDKGMPAALYMTVARTLIRATAQEGASPAEVLKRVNDLLLMDSQNGLFVTVVYAILDPLTGDMVYANAGHNLPLVSRYDQRTIEALQKGGVALGVWQQIQLVDHQVHLNAKDELLLYTDGVTEAFSPTNDAFGENRLYEVVKKAYDSSASHLLDAIDSALIQFLGENPPSDDITLLALRRK